MNFYDWLTLLLGAVGATCWVVITLYERHQRRLKMVEPPCSDCGEEVYPFEDHACSGLGG